MQYLNVHSHTFTMRNAPEKFLSLYLPPAVAGAVAKMTNTTIGAAVVEKILSTIGGNGGRRYASFLQIGKSKNQQEVFEDLLRQYEDDTIIRFVALSLYMEKTGAGPSASGYEGQLEELMQVKKQYPDRLLLFLGLDPRWKSTGKELQQTVAAYFDTPLAINASRKVLPFVGLKLYPSTGFYPFDERLMETLEWAAQNEVPVLTHCSYLGGIYNNDEKYLNSILNTPNPFNNYQPYPAHYIKENSIGRWLMGRQQSGNNLRTCSYFLEPAAYEPVLKYFKEKGTPLKLCLAHFGGSEQMLDSRKTSADVPFGVAGKNWFTQIQDLMQRYDTVYTDISYTLHNPDTHPIIFSELTNPVYGSRILFGTDFFLTEREMPERINYSNFKAAARQLPMGSTTAWDKIAGSNVVPFLRSKYYP